MSRFLGRWSDRELRELFHNLGGHDFSTLREAFSKADVDSGPNVVFAYTLKGWRLPSVGDPQNHTVTLSNLQMEQLRQELGIGEEEIWDGLEPNSPGGRLCAETRTRLEVPERRRTTPTLAPVPPDFERPHRGNISTQQIFGLFLTDIARNLPEVSERIVTVSPDVASSTNLGGWINKAGVWARGDSGPLPEEGILRALKWEELPHGPAYRAGHIRKQPVHDAGPARPRLRDGRRNVVPDRNAVRSVREAGSRRLCVQRLLRREIHSRRHSLRNNSRPGGRRSPVADYAVDRGGDARGRLLRAVLRPGAGVDYARRAGECADAPELYLPQAHEQAGRPEPVHRARRTHARARAVAQAGSRRRAPAAGQERRVPITNRTRTSYTSWPAARWCRRL